MLVNKNCRKRINKRRALFLCLITKLTQVRESCSDCLIRGQVVRCVEVVYVLVNEAWESMALRDMTKVMQKAEQATNL